MSDDPYSQGLRAKSYDDNIYEKGTENYEEFYRGFTQRMRRGYIPPSQRPVYYAQNDLKGSRIIKSDSSPKANSYKDAKMK